MGKSAGQNPLSMSRLGSPTFQSSPMAQMPFGGLFSALFGPKLDQFLIERGVARPQGSASPVAPQGPQPYGGPPPQVQALMSQLPMYQGQGSFAPRFPQQQLPPQMQTLPQMQAPPIGGLLGDG
jgi:hypothetical protein